LIAKSAKLRPKCGQRSQKCVKVGKQKFKCSLISNHRFKKYILIRPEPGVSISTGVAEPNVKAKVGENVAEALLWRTHDEVSGGSQEAVLQENNSWWTFAIGGGWGC